MAFEGLTTAQGDAPTKMFEARYLEFLKVYGLETVKELYDNAVAAG